VTDDFDPTGATKVYRASQPLPTARPLGATAEDKDIAVLFSTLDGPIEVHMELEFAKQLASQTRQAVLEVENLNRPHRQPY
jgi:hypothetical protein